MIPGLDAVSLPSACHILLSPERQRSQIHDQIGGNPKPVLQLSAPMSLKRVMTPNVDSNVSAPKRDRRAGWVADPNSHLALSGPP